MDRACAAKKYLGSKTFARAYSTGYCTLGRGAPIRPRLLLRALLPYPLTLSSPASIHLHPLGRALFHNQKWVRNALRSSKQGRSRNLPLILLIHADYLTPFLSATGSSSSCRREPVDGSVPTFSLSGERSWNRIVRGLFRRCVTQQPKQHKSRRRRSGLPTLLLQPYNQISRHGSYRLTNKCPSSRRTPSYPFCRLPPHPTPFRCQSIPASRCLKLTPGRLQIPGSRLCPPCIVQTVATTSPQPIDRSPGSHLDLT